MIETHRTPEVRIAEIEDTLLVEGDGDLGGPEILGHLEKKGRVADVRTSR